MVKNGFFKGLTYPLIFLLTIFLSPKISISQDLPRISETVLNAFRQDKTTLTGYLPKKLLTQRPKAKRAMNKFCARFNTEVDVASLESIPSAAGLKKSCSTQEITKHFDTANEKKLTRYFKTSLQTLDEFLSVMSVVNPTPNEMLSAAPGSEANLALLDYLHNEVNPYCFRSWISQKTIEAAGDVCQPLKTFLDIDPNVFCRKDLYFGYSLVTSVITTPELIDLYVPQLFNCWASPSDPANTHCQTGPMQRIVSACGQDFCRDVMGGDEAKCNLCKNNPSSCLNQIVTNFKKRLESASN